MARKSHWWLTIILILLAAGGGYWLRDLQVVPVQTQPQPQVKQTTPAKANAIKAQTFAEDPAQKMTLIREASLDFDQDQVAETIELYTAAQRDSKGEIMWDDGQKWLLLVRDGQRSYVLFDGYVQLGHLDYCAYLTTQDTFHLLIKYTDSASLVLTEFTYNPGQSSFSKSEAYLLANINWMVPFTSKSDF